MAHQAKDKKGGGPLPWVITAVALGVAVWAVANRAQRAEPEKAPAVEAGKLSAGAKGKGAKTSKDADDAKDLGSLTDFVRKYDGKKKRPLWTRQVSVKKQDYVTKGGKLKPAYTRRDMPTLGIEQLPPPRFKIINNHEHVRDEVEAKRLIRFMDQFGIERTALMGTSIYTLTLNNKYGFEEYKENNEEILRLANKYPKRLIAMPTIFPPEAGNVDLLKDYAKRGAQGLKLYLGHGSQTGKEPFHMMDLDDPRMMRVYEWAQATQFPLAFHINFTKYYAEFVRAMEAYPYLRVCVPHFGLFKNNKRRLDRLGCSTATRTCTRTWASAGTSSRFRPSRRSRPGRHASATSSPSTATG